MANTSNSRISTLIASQVPFFVRNDHSTFIKFLEKYYEYLEDVYDNKNNNLVARAKNLVNAQNIDLTEDDFAQKLYAQFMNLIPETVLCDKNLLLKHIKDFYRAKGTEKATRFLLNILFNVEDTQFYYPKKDILIASDGKWYIQRSLRISNNAINFVNDNSTAALRKYIGTRITGATSNATAVVENAETFFEQSLSVNELIISNIDGDFIEGETISAKFNDVQDIKTLSSDIVKGILSSINVIDKGTGYREGDPVVIVPAPGDPGIGAFAFVSAVSSGNLTFIAVSSGGAGFRVNDYLDITGGGGTGANGYLLEITSDGSVHPNSYLIVANTILNSANSNIANGFLVTGNNTDFETLAYSNLAIQFVRLPANSSNLRANTGNVTSITLSNTLSSSNLTITYKTPINVNNQTVIVSGPSDGNNATNTVQVYPFLTGNLDGRNINVVSGFNSASNVRINTGSGSVVETISLVSTIIRRNSSSIKVNTSASDSVNVVSLSAVPFTSNVFFTVGYQIQINGSNTTIISAEPNNSTILVSPGIQRGLISNTLNVYEPSYVSQWTQNSNVSIANGTILYINDNEYVYAYNVVPNRATINVAPKITSNLINSYFRTSNGQILSSNLTIRTALSNTVNLNAAATLSNVFFIVGDSLQVGNQNSVITSISTSTVGVSPGFYGGSYNNSFIIRRAPFNSTSNLTISTGPGAANLINLSAIKERSNVFFETYDSLNVDGTIVLVTSSNTKTANLLVTPALPGGLSSRPFEIIKRANANTTIANAMSYWVFANTGPARTVFVNDSGDGYSTEPRISVIANTAILSLGILGRMEIVDGGLNYTVGDTIEFMNQFGAYGTGALGRVKSIEANGKIKSVEFTEMPGHVIGGSGYRQSLLPTANVVTSTGNGANIVVTSILGSGARFISANSTIGAIERITIVSRGSGYANAPNIDLTQSGDGNAKANASSFKGIISYPGRWLNDDGQISSYNFLQDRDFYQKYSYVVRSSISIEEYRKPVLDLTHPAGMRLFGEIIKVDEPLYTACPCNVQNTLVSTTKQYGFYKFANTISVNYPSHGLSVGNTVGLEFYTGTINAIRIPYSGQRYGSNGNFIVTANQGSGFSAYYNVNTIGAIVSTTIVSSGNSYTSDVTIKPKENLSSNLTMTSLSVANSSVLGNVVMMLLNHRAGNSNIYFTTGDQLNLKTTSNGNYIVVIQDMVDTSNTINVSAPYSGTGPSYNLVNANVSTITAFEVITVPAVIRPTFSTESQLKATKDGLYEVTFANTDWFKVALERKLDSITIVNKGLLYNSNSHLVFTGGGGANANAVYFVNASGSITKTRFENFGEGYATEPTITANGSNSVPATFNTVLIYKANTQGNVFVSKISL